MSFLIGLHDGIRWLIIVAWVVVFLRYLLAYAANQNYLRFDRIAYRVFAGLLGINVIIGLILFVMNLLDGTLVLNLWLHMGLMLFAIVVAEIAGGRMRRLPENEKREKFLVGWVATLFVGVLVVVGVWFAGGWTFA